VLRYDAYGRGWSDRPRVAYDPVARPCWARCAEKAITFPMETWVVRGQEASAPKLQLLGRPLSLHLRHVGALRVRIVSTG
jgi:hypothetical protein